MWNPEVVGSKKVVRVPPMAFTLPPTVPLSLNWTPELATPPSTKSDLMLPVKELNWKQPILLAVTV
jgi:hypothetical protein